MASENEASCEGDPNFAVICGFFEKFGVACGLNPVDFVELQEMLENTHEVATDLIELHIKLLRKARKSVSSERWERAIVNICHTYNSQDAWEIERFGYKKARIGSKLRILKHLLEMQFDLNVRFKNEINKMSATELRTQPLGKDKTGHAYWFQTDESCTIRVYKEDPDEETWALVAKDRNGLVSLISQLDSNEAAKSGSDSVLNEDSNSLEMEKPILDTGQNDSNSSSSKQLSEKKSSEEEEEEQSTDNSTAVRNGNAVMDTDSSSALALKEVVDAEEDDMEEEEEEEEIEEEEEVEEEEEEEDEDEEEEVPVPRVPVVKMLEKPVVVEVKEVPAAIPEERPKSMGLRLKPLTELLTQPIIESEKKLELSGIKNKYIRNDPFPMSNRKAVESASYVDIYKNDHKRTMEYNSIEEPSFAKRPRTVRPTLLNNKLHYHKQYEEEDEDEEDDDYDEYDDDDDDVGEEIEEPLMLIKGEGSGKDNKCGNETESPIVGEAIEEPVMFVYGVGSGASCQTGNEKKSAEESKTSEKQTDPIEKSNNLVKKEVFRSPPKKSKWEFGENDTQSVGGSSVQKMVEKFENLSKDEEAPKKKMPSFFFGPGFNTPSISALAKTDEHEDGDTNEVSPETKQVDETKTIDNVENIEESTSEQSADCESNEIPTKEIAQSSIQVEEENLKPESKTVKDEESKSVFTDKPVEESKSESADKFVEESKSESADNLLEKNKSAPTENLTEHSISELASNLIEKSKIESKETSKNESTENLAEQSKSESTENPAANLKEESMSEPVEIVKDEIKSESVEIIKEGSKSELTETLKEKSTNETAANWKEENTSEPTKSIKDKIKSEMKSKCELTVNQKEESISEPGENLKEKSTSETIKVESSNKLADTLKEEINNESAETINEGSKCKLGKNLKEESASESVENIEESSNEPAEEIKCEVTETVKEGSKSEFPINLKEENTNEPEDNLKDGSKSDMAVTIEMESSNKSKEEIQSVSADNLKEIGIELTESNEKPESKVSEIFENDSKPAETLIEESTSESAECKNESAECNNESTDSNSESAGCKTESKESKSESSSSELLQMTNVKGDEHKVNIVIEDVSSSSETTKLTNNVDSSNDENKLSEKETETMQSDSTSTSTEVDSMNRGSELEQPVDCAITTGVPECKDTSEVAITKSVDLTKNESQAMIPENKEVTSSDHLSKENDISNSDSNVDADVKIAFKETELKSPEPEPCDASPQSVDSQPASEKDSVESKLEDPKSPESIEKNCDVIVESVDLKPSCSIKLKPLEDVVSKIEHTDFKCGIKEEPVGLIPVEIIDSKSVDTISPEIAETIAQTELVEPIDLKNDKSEASIGEMESPKPESEMTSPVEIESNESALPDSLQAKDSNSTEDTIVQNDELVKQSEISLLKDDEMEKIDEKPKEVVQQSEIAKEMEDQTKDIAEEDSVMEAVDLSSKEGAEEKADNIDDETTGLEIKGVDVKVLENLGSTSAMDVSEEQSKNIPEKPDIEEEAKAEKVVETSENAVEKPEISKSVESKTNDVDDNVVAASCETIDSVKNTDKPVDEKPVVVSDVAVCDLKPSVTEDKEERNVLPEMGDAETVIDLKVQKVSVDVRPATTSAIEENVEISENLETLSDISNDDVIEAEDKENAAFVAEESKEMNQGLEIVAPKVQTLSENILPEKCQTNNNEVDESKSEKVFEPKLDTSAFGKISATSFVKTDEILNKKVLSEPKVNASDLIATKTNPVEAKHYDVIQETSISMGEDAAVKSRKEMHEITKQTDVTMKSAVYEETIVEGKGSSKKELETSGVLDLKVNVKVKEATKPESSSKEVEIEKINLEAPVAEIVESKDEVADLTVTKSAATAPNNNTVKSAKRSFKINSILSSKEKVPEVKNKEQVEETKKVLEAKNEERDEEKKKVVQAESKEQDEEKKSVVVEERSEVSCIKTTANVGGDKNSGEFLPEDKCDNDVEDVGFVARSLKEKPIKSAPKDVMEIEKKTQEQIATPAKGELKKTEMYGAPVPSPKRSARLRNASVKDTVPDVAVVNKKAKNNATDEKPSEECKKPKLETPTPLESRKLRLRNRSNRDSTSSLDVAIINKQIVKHVKESPMTKKNCDNLKSIQEGVKVIAEEPVCLKKTVADLTEEMPNSPMSFASDGGCGDMGNVSSDYESEKEEEKPKPVELKEEVDNKKEVEFKPEESIEKAVEVKKEEPKVDDKIPSITALSFDYTGSPPPAKENINVRVTRKRGRASPPAEMQQAATGGKRRKMRGKRTVDTELRKSIEDQKKKEISSSDEEKNQASKKQKKSEETKESTKKGHKKKRTLLGLDIPDAMEVVQTGVRQSRRIAQIKIKEEAERRKIEELTMQDIKEKHKKSSRKEDDKDYKAEKRKRNKTAVTEDETTNDAESDEKKKKKLKRKHKNPKFDEYNPWKSSSDSSSQESHVEEEEEEYEEEDGEAPIKSDHEFSPESDLENGDEVQPLKRARTVRKEDAPEDVVELDDTSCEKCGKSDHPEWILLCDGCDSGWHCSCLRPALLVIPEGDWYCPPCLHNTLVINLQNRLIEFDKQVSKRQAEVRRKERLAYVGISLDNVLPTKEHDESIKSRPKQQRRDIRYSGASESASESSSSSGSGSGSTGSESEDEPIYQLRQRRQAHSYRFNDYDELINSAIQDEVQSAVVVQSTENRGKDMQTIVNAEAAAAAATAAETQPPEALPPVIPINADLPSNLVQTAEEAASDEEVIRPVKKLIGKKKHRKLNSLDISSDDDDQGSDEDFKGSSSDEEEDDEFDEDLDSDSSEFGRRKRKGGPVRRSTRARISRYDRDFINDDSDEDYAAPRRKKTRSIWDESESEESDRSWGRRKKKSTPRKAPSTPRPRKPKSKKKKKNDDDSDAEVYSKKKPKIKFGGLDSEEDIGRRTRGKKITYVDALGSDSDDDLRRRNAVNDDDSEDEFVLNEEEDLRDEVAGDSDDSNDDPLVVGAIKSGSKKGKGKGGIKRIKRAQGEEEEALFPPLPDDFTNTEVVQQQQQQEGAGASVEKEPNPIEQMNKNLEAMDEKEMEMMMEEEEYANKQLQMVAEQLEKEKRRKEMEVARKQLEEMPPTVVPQNFDLPPMVVETMPVLEPQTQLHPIMMMGEKTPKKRGRKPKSLSGSAEMLHLMPGSGGISTTPQSDDMSDLSGTNLNPDGTPKKRRGRGKGKKTLEKEAAAAAAAAALASNAPSEAGDSNEPSLSETGDSSNDPQLIGGKLGVATAPQPFSQSQPVPSVITRMLQTQPGKPAYPVGPPINYEMYGEGRPEGPSPPIPSQSPQGGPPFLSTPGGPRGVLPPGYRPVLNHYPVIRSGAPPPMRHRSPGPHTMTPNVFHTHHPLDPSPSGGSAVATVSSEHGSPAPSASPLSNKSDPTPPPLPATYARPPLVRFPAAGPMARHPLPMMAQHMQRPNMPFSHFHYGPYQQAAASSGEDGPHFNNPNYSEFPPDGEGPRNYDEENGEFGGLVSYFSSQREDDLDT